MSNGTGGDVDAVENFDDGFGGHPGAELAALANKLRVADIDGLDALTGFFKSMSSDFTEHSDSVTKEVAKVHDAWTGVSGEAFAQYMNEFTNKANKVSLALQEIAIILTSVGDILIGAQQVAYGYCGDALTAAQAIQKTSAGKPREEIQKLFRDSFSGSERELRNLISNTENELSKVLGDLDSAAKILGTQFTQMTPPLDEQAFTLRALTSPDAHYTIDDLRGWQPKPDPSQSSGPISTGTQGAAPITHPVGVGVGVPSAHVPAPMHSAGAMSITPMPVFAKPSKPLTKEELQKIVTEALHNLANAGTDVSKIDPNKIMEVIGAESSGITNAINDHVQDHRIGLMQVTASGFEQYKLPGHTDINNPVDNTIAGIQQVIHKYGGTDHIPGLPPDDSQPYSGLFAPPSELPTVLSPLRHSEINQFA